jgi:hypothetical protein
MWGLGVGRLMPETVEAVDHLDENDPNCELCIEDVVWVADQFRACPDTVLLLSRNVMSDNWNHYVSFSERYDFGPMTIWSAEAARGVLATGLPLDGVEFQIAGGEVLGPDDVYRIARGWLDTDLPVISEPSDVLGSLEDQRIEENAAQPLQRAA